jgi:peptidyl-prolyl cis-trans isomerase D
MSVLKKIRENVGLVIVIIAISLFAFIFSSVYKDFGSGGEYTVGEVNGHTITFAELNSKFELAQRNNPDATSTAEQYQLKEQAWQSLVREAYYSKEWEEAGIGISDDELMLMFTNVIQHPYVVQSGFFNDSTGKYNPALVSQVFQRADEIDVNDSRIDPNWIRWKLGLLDLRNILSLDRRSNKWQAAIKGSALVSDNEVKLNYENQQRAADISYLFVPYNSIPDEQIQVTDGDRNEYLKKHREAFTLPEEMVRIKYTYFKIAPSHMDSAKTFAELLKLREEFRITDDAFSFANTSSDDRMMDTTPKPLSELPVALSAVGGRTDTVVGPILGATGYQLLRIVKVEEDSLNANVQLRHILVALNGSTKEDSTKARAKADSLLGILAGDKSEFAQVAMENSDDNTRMNGGDLGWVTENAFGDQFAKDLKAAKVGSIIVTSSQSGYHVVELLGRSNKRFSYASITRVVGIGTETNDSIFKRASLFHGDILAGGDMDSVSRKYTDARTLNSGNIGPGTYNLFGLAAGRGVVTWAFNNEQGAICQKIIEAEDAFVVAKVEYKSSRGYSTLESLKEDPAFESMVLNWMKAKKIKANLVTAGSDLQGMATAYGASATTGQAKDLHFASNEVPNVGNEPKVVGRAFGLRPNAVSAPLAGNMGVFVVKLDAIREPSPIDEFNKMLAMQTLKSSKSEQTVNAIFQALRENANVVDMRYKAEF